MTPLEVIKDPNAAPSSVWKALEALLSASLKVYEPETFALELRRLGVEWTAGLAAKVLGAQTILITNDWTFDHDVLFAFALACDGIGAASDALHHPTPVQLAWAVMEIEALRGEKITEDHGFDPDTIDPAIAVLLHDDGWVCPPHALAFASKSLAKMDQSNGKLRESIEARWPTLRDADEDEARAIYAGAKDSPLKVQLGHLYDCELEMRARARLRHTHHDACTNQS